MKKIEPVTVSIGNADSVKESMNESVVKWELLDQPSSSLSESLGDGDDKLQEDEASNSPNEGRSSQMERIPYVPQID